MSEEIVLPPLSKLVPGLSERTTVSIQLNYNATGGTFSISTLKDTSGAPKENSLISLPNGRLATVKSTGRGYSRGGLVDVVSGPIVPPIGTLPTLVGIPNNVFVPAATLAQQCGNGIGVIWATSNPLVRGFIYRGIALNGIQQLASFVSAEVIVRSGGVYVVNPGEIIGSAFAVPKADLVSADQTIDYSLDFPSTLNPALSADQLIPDGQFVYDSDHAQKQGKTTVQAGAPGSAASSDFIPIPDGWLVDGNYEEWQPQNSQDFTNPQASPQNGRYWKIYQSPINPGMLRGITNFTRIIKQINIPGNVSTFVGSPVTGLTLPDVGRAFAFSDPGSEEGIYGFNAGQNTGTDPIGIEFFDIISHQFYSFPTAIVLVPTGGVDSGDAAANFYSITMEIWTFPKVNPKIFPIGNPVNPFGLPKDVLVVNPPMNNVIFSTINALTTYWEQYMINYRLINSPRLRTTISCVYRGFIPQPGDELSVGGGLQVGSCGRISSVSLNLSRTGLVLNIVAERYQYGTGLYNKYPAIFNLS